jgi:hypothetical protein
MFTIQQLLLKIVAFFVHPAYYRKLKHVAKITPLTRAKAGCACRATLKAS